MEKIDRRVFLKIASLTLFGISSGGFLDIVKPDDLKKTLNKLNDKTLKAKRWAIAVDLRTINDKIMNKCIFACNKAHNIPEINMKGKEIKWIWKENFKRVFPEINNQSNNIFSNVPVLCNHCDNPPCVRVCPTKATFSRKDGIVVVDMHRCIGCKFCIVACPYGSRSFNFVDPVKYIKKINLEYPTREEGVVEKCDMCIERIDKNKLPLCVEVSEGTLMFGDINNPDSKIMELLRTRVALRRKPELGTKPQIYYLI